MGVIGTDDIRAVMLSETKHLGLIRDNRDSSLHPEKNRDFTQNDNFGGVVFVPWCLSGKIPKNVLRLRQALLRGAVTSSFCHSERSK